MTSNTGCRYRKKKHHPSKFELHSHRRFFIIKMMPGATGHGVGTPPRGMLLAVLSLMYIIMALNIVMFALVPDYTMFGNQHFQHNITGKGSPAPRSFHLPQLWRKNMILLLLLISRFRVNSWPTNTKVTPKLSVKQSWTFATLWQSFKD